MLCEKCKKEHDGSFGSGRFCSKNCAFKREYERKKGSSSWINVLKEKDLVKYIQYCEKQREDGIISHIKQSIKLKETYDKKPWGELGKDAKRRRVLDEQKHKCNVCGLSEWRGQKLTLEIEHKDGNHMNDNRENLEGLCPNCHSITETWRGRNKEFSKQGKITDEVLITALRTTETIRQALIVVGLSPRGGNYIRAKRLLNEILS